MSIALIRSRIRLRQEISRQLESIDNLNLSCVIKRLCSRLDKNGNGWCSERAKIAEMWYRRFLRLKILRPGALVLPIGDIDEVWHCHILFTRKYHEDCNLIFGHYLHHNPAVTAQDRRKLARALEPTLNLYRQEFGEVPEGVTVGCCDGTYCD